MKKIINQTRLQDFVLIMLVLASCITCVLWIGFMLSKKRPKTEDDEFTLMVNDAEHWEKPNWIVVNSGSLYVGMMSMLASGQYIQEKGDLRIVRTEYVKKFLEENNENV